MGKATAGETVTFIIDNATVIAKVEDGSKSECILAKVQTSQSAQYSVGQVYEFDRDLLAKE